MTATRRVYMDNAATSAIKPPGVAEAMFRFVADGLASAGRGAYREALATGRVIQRCRERLARLMNSPRADHVIFTLNCSDALNLAIHGLLRPGDHVVTTQAEHNSVLRPLHAQQARQGVTTTYVAVDPHTMRVDPAAIRAAITPRTRLVAVVHASNVTGVIQPIGEIGEVCRRAGVPYLVDAAQSAGHVPIDVAAMGIGLLALPGHKGLLGPQGTGALIVSPELVERLETVRQGGTGSASELPTQPSAMPDKYEPGSHNAVGIAGWEAALAWLEQTRVARLHQEGQALSAQMLAELEDVPGLELFGPRDVAERVGVFTLRLAGHQPQELSAALEAEFGVLSRSGVHCAPFIHQLLGTADGGGATRLSLGAFTTADDVTIATAGLRELATAACAVA